MRARETLQLSRACCNRGHDLSQAYALYFTCGSLIESFLTSRICAVTPEGLATDNLRQLLESLHRRGLLARLVIDEVWMGGRDIFSAQSLLLQEWDRAKINITLFSVE